MSGDDPHLLPRCQSAGRRTALRQDPARAVHAIGVRAQAPMGSGDSPPRAGPGRHALPDPLTDRELVVLQLLRGSLSRPQIAAELRRSPNTIKTQTQAIYRKLGVSTRHAAITSARSPQVWPGRHALPDPLSGRELVVLQLLRGSLSRPQIAGELGRSPNTIKTQTQAIYRKLGVSTRRAAITRGLDAGVLPSRGRQPHEVTSQ
jgi:DNA-binding NarL/FixJ family response regulator